MFAAPVSRPTQRSRPIAKPPWGGMPRRNASVPVDVSVNFINPNTGADLTNRQVYPSDSPRFDPTMLVECHPHADPDAWLLENPGFVSGGNLRWWRDNFAPLERAGEAEGKGDAYDLLAEEARSIDPGSDGVVGPCSASAR